MSKEGKGEEKRARRDEKVRGSLFFKSVSLVIVGCWDPAGLRPAQALRRWHEKSADKMGRLSEILACVT